MSGHKHLWVWLPQIKFVFSGPSFSFKAFNVQCDTCKRLRWAHGKGPTR